MKNKFAPDFWVQLGILIVAGLCMLGATISWSLGYFATKDEVQVEREERHELKAEIDTLYKTQVPPDERKPLFHPHKIGEE